VSDTAVRAATRMLLRAYGMQVCEYGCAAAYLAEPPASCRCLIADCRLADMPAQSLYREMIARHDATPMVVITAAPEAFNSLRESHPRLRVLDKPFDGERLISAIPETLSYLAGASATGRTAPAAC